MADSDVAPSSDPAPTGTEPPRPAGPPQALPKAPRANPPTIAERRDSSGAGKVSLEDLITWLRRIDGAASPGAAPGRAEAESQPNVSKEQRKFRRFEPPAAKATPAPTQTGGDESAAAPKDAEAAEQEAGKGGTGSRADDGSVVTGVAFKGARKTKPPPPNLLSSVFVQGFVLILMAACFFLGRETLSLNGLPASKPAGANPSRAEPAGIVLFAPEMNLLDQAIAAEGAGDLAKASGIFDQLRHANVHVNGLDYQMAWLAYQEGKPAEAAPLLSRSIAEGENVGECYDLRGLIVNHRSPEKGLHDFETATQVDPFAAESFFHWGEALRRLGKPQEAIVRLREAADRAQSPAELATYQLKVRLAQVELGDEKDFARELATQMALPRPPPEWVLTAAAQEMHAGDYSAAAAHLNRLRQSMNPTTLARELQDYFFMGYADKEPLVGLYAQILSPSAPARSSQTPAETPAVALPATLSPAVPPAAATASPAAVP